MSGLLNGHTEPSYQAVKDDEEMIHEEEWVLSNGTKKWLIAAGVLVAAGFLYLFCFLLPLMFIPELRVLEGIAHVDELNVRLRPVSAPVVALWGLDASEINEARSIQMEEEDEDVTDVELSSDVEVESRKKAKDRLIVVGDIHGQYKEMRRLLRKVKYSPKHDELLVLGDFMAKGPDSFKVIDYLVDVNASCVLGNHEYYALQNYARFHGLSAPYFESGNGTSRIITDRFIEDPEFLLAKKLLPHHVEYINLCSVIKKLGRVPLHARKNNGTHKWGTGIAVHAGLRWDLTSLEEQDPVDCMEMRSYLAPFYNQTTDDPRADGAVSWSKIWNKKHTSGELKDKNVVYYGHDARRGLNLKRYAKGLDNGCSRGDFLAAMVIWQEEAAGKILYKEQAVRVAC